MISLSWYTYFLLLGTLIFAPFPCVDETHNTWKIMNTTDKLPWRARRRCRCNRLRCLLARMSGLQCFNMGHNGYGINLYGVSMTLMENLHGDGQSSLGYLSLVHRPVCGLFSNRRWLIRWLHVNIITCS